MLTHQDLTFTENFRCRTWQRHHFPAYTRVADIAKQIGYSESKVKTAIQRRKHTLAEWDIVWA